MSNDSLEEHRKTIFVAVKRWAEANLAGEIADPPFPTVIFSHHHGWPEVAQRLQAIEARLSEVQANSTRNSFRCALAADGAERDDGLASLLVGSHGTAATRTEGIKEIRNRCTNPILKVGSAERRGDALALSLKPPAR